MSILISVNDTGKASHDKVLSNFPQKVDNYNGSDIRDHSSSQNDEEHNTYHCRLRSPLGAGRSISQPTRSRQGNGVLSISFPFQVVINAGESVDMLHPTAVGCKVQKFSIER